MMIRKQFINFAERPLRFIGAEQGVNGEQSSMNISSPVFRGSFGEIHDTPYFCSIFVEGRVKG